MPKLSRNYLKEGYMEKTGPKVGYKCFCNTPNTKAFSVLGGERSAGGTVTLTGEVKLKRCNHVNEHFTPVLWVWKQRLKNLKLSQTSPPHFPDCWPFLQAHQVQMVPETAFPKLPWPAWVLEAAQSNPKALGGAQ